MSDHNQTWADLRADMSATERALHAVQQRMEAAFDALRALPLSDTSPAEARPTNALDALLLERQRLLARLGALWMEWTRLGGHPVWMTADHPGKSADAPPLNAPPSSPALPGPNTAEPDTTKPDTTEPETSTPPTSRVSVQVLARPEPRFAVTHDIKSLLQTKFAEQIDLPDPDPEHAGVALNHDILDALLRLAGPPVFLSDPHSDPQRLRDEVERLKFSSDTHQLAGLRRLPRYAQTQFLSLLIARLRALQDIPGPHLTEVNALFPVLETFSRLHKPGLVNGFSRKHTPRRGSWLKDARLYHQKLTDLLKPPAPPDDDNPERLLHEISLILASPPSDPLPEPSPQLSPSESSPADSPPSPLNDLCKRFMDAATDHDPRFLKIIADHSDLLSGKTRKRVKKALIRAERLALSHAPADSTPSTSPNTASPTDSPDFLSLWPWRHHTQGQRAVIIGGEDQREDIRSKVQLAFGFSDLEWHPANHPKRLETLAQRVKTGSLDLVILLKRFISHRVEDVVVKPCKKNGVRYLYLEQGYSPDQLRQSIERHLPPSPTADADPTSPPMTHHN